MSCKHCGGIVQWQGPLGALTHTKCLSCGAINCQVEEPCTNCCGAGYFGLDSTCRVCNGTGKAKP